MHSDYYYYIQLVSFITSIIPIYTRTRVTIYNYTWRIPLASISPCWFPLSSPLYSPLLTWNPPSCDRNRPPQSQVACKLTPPVPLWPPVPSLPKFQPPLGFPRPNMHLIRATLQPNPLWSRTCIKALPAFYFLDSLLHDAAGSQT
jgi:hypothetical protein